MSLFGSSTRGRRRPGPTIRRQPLQKRSRRITATQILACAGVAVICLALIILIWINTERAIREQNDDTRGRVETALLAQAATLAARDATRTADDRPVADRAAGRMGRQPRRVRPGRVAQEDAGAGRCDRRPVHRQQPPHHRAGHQSGGGRPGDRFGLRHLCHRLAGADPGQWSAGTRQCHAGGRTRVGRGGPAVPDVHGSSAPIAARLDHRRILQVHLAHLGICLGRPGQGRHGRIDRHASWWVAGGGGDRGVAASVGARQDPHVPGHAGAAGRRYVDRRHTDRRGGPHHRLPPCPDPRPDRGCGGGARPGHGAGGNLGGGRTNLGDVGLAFGGGVRRHAAVGGVALAVPAGATAPWRRRRRW